MEELIQENHGPGPTEDFYPNPRGPLALCEGRIEAETQVNRAS